MVFWAWEQHQKVRAKLREEGRQKGLAEGRDEGLAEGEAIGLEKGRAKGQAATAERFEKWLTQVAEKRGIALAELMPPDEDAPVC